MESHDETGRDAERRRLAAEPYLERLDELRMRRAAAITLADALRGDAQLIELHRAVRYAREALIARRDYREALAYGRPLTRRQRRQMIRQEAKVARDA